MFFGRRKPLNPPTFRFGDRKIFFLGAWLAAFLDGQVSPEAEAVVQQWLAQPGIEPDLRLKVLENADELERTVRIRQKFPD